MPSLNFMFSSAPRNVLHSFSPRLSWNSFFYPQAKDIDDTQKRMASAKIKNGPCESSLEPVLQKHGIQRQSYHGGAFVGNHVHKALSPTVVSELTSAPVAVIAARCPGPPLAGEVDAIKCRYNDLMTQYAQCSASFSVSTEVNDEDLTLLDGRIQTFMSTARREVVDRRRGNVTPKLHLLEDHLLPCMRRFGVGLGLLGEKGGEGIHHDFNILGSTFSSIRDDLQRLKTIVSQHCVATLPQHKSHIPVTATRQKKSD